MPSDAAKKRQAKKKSQAQARGKPKSNNNQNQTAVDETNGISSTATSNGDSIASCTGVLASHPESRDVHIENFSITFHGVELLCDTRLELNCGRRYGLLGLNGCGKSTLMNVIANREIPVPEHIDVFHLQNEIDASEKTALECVVEVNEERARLEHEAELLTSEGDQGSERLMYVYERLEELDIDKAVAHAARILHGLGFTASMQRTKTKDFSGGWRMRIALARALFVKPTLLLLDEPTNHLDLDACVWLEEELKKYKRILVIVSHSQDFLNGVCTNIIHMHEKSLKYYGGNFDSYVKTRAELEENQMKQYNWEQDQIKHMKDYIARFGHGSAKLARQAQSKEKVLAKMVAGGLTEKVKKDKVVSFSFPGCEKLHPPVIQVQHVSFKYSSDKHLQDMLDLEMSAVAWMMQCFPEVKEIDDMRKSVGRYGLTGKQQMCPMKNLSDGQRCRVVLAWLAFHGPHLLLLDEPTNHLDIETIDALADALNDFDGGMLLVSHDFRLISQVAKEVWLCEKQMVKKWEGDIISYKNALKKKVAKYTTE